MKKEYNKPTMAIVMLKGQQCILAGSLQMKDEDASITGGYYDD